MAKKACRFAMQCRDECNVCEDCGTEKFIINTECHGCRLCESTGPAKSAKLKTGTE